jgi:hypothetical protein
MRKILLLIIALCAPSLSALAQKDAPVAGHAANLVDLLKKDYNAIDPELRGEEIIKDRALVISIFKSYFTDPQRAGFNSMVNNLNDKAVKVRVALEDLNTAKKKITTLNALMSNPVSDRAVGSMVNELAAVSGSFEKKKFDYLTEKCELDIGELRLILCKYEEDPNEYIVYVISLFITKYEQLQAGTDSFASSNYTAAITKSIPFIGGELAFEMVVDGLSRFLAKRIKEELTNQVIERVKDWLKNKDSNDPLAEFKVMLPRTTEYLIEFQADKITSFPDEIKQYIEDDLNHALSNAANLRNAPRIRQLIEKHPDLDFAMEAIELIPNLSKLKNPADYFKTIENSRNLRRWNLHGNPPAKFNIANLIQLSCMIGQSMLIIDNGELRFAGKDFMGAYVGEKNFYLLYLGFLYQQNVKYYDIEFQYKEDSKRKNLILAEELKAIVRKPVDNEFLLERRFFNFMLTSIGDNAEKVLVSATEIRKANKAGKTVGADSVYRFVESMINLSENVVFASGALIDYIEIGHAEYPSRIRQGRSVLGKVMTPYFMVARTFNEVAFDIQKSKFANALIKVIELKDKLADEVVLSNTNLVSRVNQMDNIHSYPTTGYWPKVIQYITSPPTPPAPDFQIKLVIDDVGYIDILRRQIYPENSAPPLLIEAFKQVENISIANVQARDIKAQKLVALASDPTFRKLAVAYFSGIWTDKIVTEEEVIKLRERFPHRHEGATGGVDDSREILAIKNTASDYSEKLGGVLINGEVTDEILKAKAALEKRINEYQKTFNSSVAERPSARVISLIHFVNDMALAKNAEDVEKAIEAFALPTGSYTIKRKAKFNFSINSFPGLLPAIERPWKTSVETDATGPGSSFSLGFTAPVGFSGAWILSHSYRCRCYYKIAPG